MALKTITLKHKDFREVSIRIHFDSFPSLLHSLANTQQTAGGDYIPWMNLDHQLVQLGESHKACIMVKYSSRKKKKAPEFIKGVLAEMAKRGGIMLDDADSCRYYKVCYMQFGTFDRSFTKIR